MPETALLISILVFAGIMFLGSGIYSYYNRRKNQRELVRKIKSGTEGSHSGENFSDQYKDTDGTGSFKKHFLSITKSLGSIIKPKIAAARTVDELYCHHYPLHHRC